MHTTDVFTVGDLTDRGCALIHEAEAGRLSLITERGHPKIVALPFNERLLELGVHQSFAVSLLEQRLVTLAQAAKIAKLSLGDFLTVLRETGVEAVDYPAAELGAEMEIRL